MKYTTYKLDIDTKDITDTVYKMTELWISRSNEYPFFTLGRNAYQDGKTSDYNKDIKWQNNLMAQNFYNLYEKVLYALGTHFRETVTIAPDLSIPGFHIFPSDPVFIEKEIVGHYHYDNPHEILGINSKFNHAYTVAIELPSSGGGMDYISEEHFPIHIPYKVGDIVIHDGSTLHRISGLKKYVPNEYRITLQGHIIRRNGILETFW